MTIRAAAIERVGRIITLVLALLLPAVATSLASCRSRAHEAAAEAERLQLERLAEEERARREAAERRLEEERQRIELEAERARAASEEASALREAAEAARATKAGGEAPDGTKEPSRPARPKIGSVGDDPLGGLELR